MTVTLVIPGRPIGSNQVLGAHWRTFLRAKRQIQHDTAFVWMEAGRPTFEQAVVRVRCVFGTPHRRDPQNYLSAGTVKVVLDQLTQSGCWPDDNPNHVQIAGVECVYRKGVWQTELELMTPAEALASEARMMEVAR